MNLFFDLFKTFDGGGGDLFFIYKKYDCDYVGFWKFIDIQIKREIFMR